MLAGTVAVREEEFQLVFDKVKQTRIICRKFVRPSNGGVSRPTH